MVLPHMDTMLSSFQVPGPYFHLLVYGNLGFHVGITSYTMQTLHLQVLPSPCFSPFSVFPSFPLPFSIKSNTHSPPDLMQRT